MINNRQAGRRRGRGGQGGQGGQRPQGGPNRFDNGSRIDNRARGNAAQLLEKYKNLASEAQRQGDRVNAEYYLQFADHYFRVLNENRVRVEEQRRVSNDEEEDFDGDDNGESMDRDDDRTRDQRDGNRNDSNRYENRGEGNRYEARGNDNRNDGNRGNEVRGQDGPRQDGPRQDGPRQDGQRGRFRDGERRPERAAGNDRGQDGGDRPNGGYAGTEPAAAAVEASQPEPTPVAFEPQAGVEGEPVQAPRRRGRPRRNPEGEGAPADDAAPVAIEADRLPPSLTGGSPSSDEEPAPRRRGRPRKTVTAEVTPA